MTLVRNSIFRIEDRVKYTVKGKSEYGTVVYIFKKLEIPKVKKLFKYYGHEIINPKYGRLFGPMFEDRIVVKKDNGNYAICPMTGNGRYFKLEHEKILSGKNKTDPLMINLRPIINHPETTISSGFKDGRRRITVAGIELIMKELHQLLLEEQKNEQL